MKRDQYIYLVFSKTGTILSQVLKFFSKTKYVHTSISLDSDFTQMFSFGRKNPYNPFSGGFVIESLYEGVYERFPLCECHIVKVPVTDEQLKVLKKELNSFLLRKNTYKYNFLGLFGILLNRPIKRSNHYFCSQFISELLIKSGIYTSNKPPELIRSDELILIDHQESYYTGFVRGIAKTPAPLQQLYNFTLKL